MRCFNCGCESFVTEGTKVLKVEGYPRSRRFRVQRCKSCHKYTLTEVMEK